MGDETYWEWRHQQLKHPDGRAVGGEPCVICGSPIPANANWKSRDFHVCSSACNMKLARRFNRRRDRDNLKPPAGTDPYSDRTPLLFRTLTEAEFPYEFLGWSPRVGDVIERHGSLTAYAKVTFTDEDLAQIEKLAATDDPRTAVWRRNLVERGIIAHHLNSGSTLVSTTTDTGTLERVVHQVIGPEGRRIPYHRPFTTDSGSWVWTGETIRHVMPDGDTSYTWSAFVCVPHPVPDTMGGKLWTPEYQERSTRLKRVSDHTARHARRLRMLAPDGVVERIDPTAVYERDRWMCQLCGKQVDPGLRHPELMSANLDHRMPLVLGGHHTWENVQASHLICNIRKGATG